MSEELASEGNRSNRIRGEKVEEDLKSKLRVDGLSRRSVEKVHFLRLHSMYVISVRKNYICTKKYLRKHRSIDYN